MEQVYYIVNGRKVTANGKDLGPAPKEDTAPAEPVPEVGAVPEVDTLKARIAELEGQLAGAPPVTVTGDGPPPAKTGDTTTTSDLPDDFPGKQLLIDAGYVSRAQVSGLSDEALKAIKGIGPSTFDQIRAYK